MMVPCTWADSETPIRALSSWSLSTQVNIFDFYVVALGQLEHWVLEI